MNTERDTLASACVAARIAQVPCLKLSAPAGEVQASKEIASGALQAGSFRFFSGLMEWESSRLLQDIQRGLW